MKDANDTVIKTLKLEIEGKILTSDTSVIGTLLPTKNSEEEPRIMTRNLLIELETKDPSIIDRWVEHIEVILEKTPFKGAKIEVTQANALVNN